MLNSKSKPKTIKKSCYRDMCRSDGKNENLMKKQMEDRLNE